LGNGSILLVCAVSKGNINMFNQVINVLLYHKGVMRIMRSNSGAIVAAAAVLLVCRQPSGHEPKPLRICDHIEPTREIIDSSGSIVKLVPERPMPELDGACWC
jgi:hypothetical protein